MLALLGPSDRSMLPFIPRPVKLLVALLFLMNWRSWPFVWHCELIYMHKWLICGWSANCGTPPFCVDKVWKPVIDIRWDAMFKARTPSDRRRWISTVSCINADPFEIISLTKCYAGARLRARVPYTLLTG